MSEPYRPIIVAHRGLHIPQSGGGQCCENSLFGFIDAIVAGVRWVECDVWASADGAVVVIHDETLERTTTGSGPVSSRLWESLSPLNLRLPNGRVDCNETLPCLPKIAGVLEDPDDPPGILVEIKPPDAPGLVREVTNVLEGRSLRWMIQSFDEQNLIHALVCDISTPVAFLVEDREALERGITNGWKNIHLLHTLLDEPTTRRLRGAGVSVGVWTPNTPADLRRVMDLRADVIITDEPLLAMRMARP